VAFIDTDFLTTQAFCKKYEGREHPFVQALMDEYRFDLVILLENNTPWVADGLRSLGSTTDRSSFQNLLIEMLQQNNIDYVHVKSSQAQYIDFAVKYANKVAFIDTDFLTTQAFCKKYEGREHPFVQALMDEYRFDLVILLENNTPWVADGLRSLGSTTDRSSFQNLLIEMLQQNNIDYVHVKSSDYDERFLECVELVQIMLAADTSRVSALPKE